MKAVVDNDVLLKATAYGVLHDLLTPFGNGSGELGVLGTVKPIVLRKLRRLGLHRDIATVQADFLAFLAGCDVLEPTPQEKILAADLELAGLKLGLNLDAGESQLCAIATTRLIPLLLTGDKRAICSIEALLNQNATLAPLCGKVKCLEQLFSVAIQRTELSNLRSSVCSEPGIDKALTACFACSSAKVSRKDITVGLESYIEDLRKRAGRILSP